MRSDHSRRRLRTIFGTLAVTAMLLLLSACTARYEQLRPGPSAVPVNPGQTTMIH